VVKQFPEDIVGLERLRALAALLVSRTLSLSKTFSLVCSSSTYTEKINEIHRQTRPLVEILVFGDFLGLPLLSTYYSLRLLPYVYPSLSEIRKETVKEHDVFDLLGEHHH
jgi:hypothetical protein